MATDSVRVADCPAASSAAVCDPKTGEPWDAKAYPVPAACAFAPLADIAPTVAAVRAEWRRGALRGLDARRHQLRQLALMVQENSDTLCAAMVRDLHKSRSLSMMTEMAIVVNECAEAIAHLDAWARPERPRRGLVNLTDTVEVRSEPLGVVLVIGAWNYPVQLTLAPMVSAIAAGNAVILKPSEVSPTTAQVLADLIPRYMDPNLFRVINGGVEETTELLKHRFDHIIYTGNSQVARIVMSAAAKYLTPVTLELGGKSPTIVHSSADVETAARRIVFGKYMNAGQTCLAPDYILCPRSLQEPLVAALHAAIAAFYGDDPKQSTDYCRIVNQRHYDRIMKLFDSFDVAVPEGENPAKFGGHVAIGGGREACDRDTLYIPPTVLTDVGADAPVMQAEIFGPIIPIVPLNDGTDEVDPDGIDAFTRAAVAFITEREHPLALYLFSRNNTIVNWVLDNTQSGGVTVNDTILHCATPGLPFGGIGESGMGQYHGKWGFDAFSHKRGTLIKPMSGEWLNAIRYPPYTDKSIGWVDWLLFKKVK